MTPGGPWSLVDSGDAPSRMTGGWRRGGPRAAERSGPPAAGPPLAERRFRQVGDAAGRSGAAPATGPARLAHGLRAPRRNDATTQRRRAPRARRGGAHDTP